MNKTHINKGLNFNKMFNQQSAKPAVVTAIFLSIFSTLTFSPQASANRPAMDEQAKAISNESINKAEEIEVEAIEAEAPSSVELMMQQQTRQTGDVIRLPAKEIQPGETLKITLLDYPRRGMSMNKVQQEYGQPIAISDSVGKPPITRWTYNDRVVYFEYSTVLHVVAR